MDLKLILIVLTLLHLGLFAKHHSILETRPLYLRVRYGSLCANGPPEINIKPGSNITYVGSRFLISAVGTISRTIKNIEKVIVSIRQCNDAAEDRNCEHFQTMRFGREMCPLLQQKHLLWTPLIESFHPEIKCPVLKGEYRIVNGTMDTKALQEMFSGIPLEKHFWRIRLEIYDYKMFACDDFGVSFYRGRKF